MQERASFNACENFSLKLWDPYIQIAKKPIKSNVKKKFNVKRSN